MNKFIKVISLSSFVLSLFAGALQAQTDDIEAMEDKLYYDIAVILESGISNPERCVAEIDDYFVTNESTIEKIKQSWDEPAVQVDTMVDEFGLKDRDKIKSIEEEARHNVKKRESKITPGFVTYAKALTKFAIKNPNEAKKVSDNVRQLHLYPKKS